MKNEKTIIALFTFVSLVTGIQAQKIDQGVESFVLSKEFDAFSANSAFADAGDIDFSNVKVQQMLNPETKKQTKVYTLLFTEGGKVTGAMQVFKVRDDFKGLPAESNYMMLFRDYKGYDFDTKNGVIRIYDLNYDEYLAAQIQVKDGKVTAFTVLPMPETIREKYKDNIKATADHFCDGNHNGNVSWGECYRCMKSACDNSDDCAGLCDVIDLFGGQCTGSIAASCVIISSIY